MEESRRAFWDAQAATFDDMPDHGLTDPQVREAWRSLLARVLPAPPARVVDIGCGTGSLSLLLAEAGFEVVGVDFSREMVRLARTKAGRNVALLQADAAAPPFLASVFDAVVARHILWALEDVDGIVQRWLSLLRPDGVLVLVGGRWSTGTGLPAADLKDVVTHHRPHVEILPLDDPALWSHPIKDERYLLRSTS